MDVAIVHFEDCPHWQSALNRLRDAMRTLGLDTSRIQTVRFRAADVPAGFPGSPTILIDNRDLFAHATPAGPTCRRYHTDQGIDGVPSPNSIVVALGQTMDSRPTGD
jgi:hypothetical protein